MAWGAIWWKDVVMIVRLLVFTACALLGSGSVTAEEPLDGRIRFADAYRCEPDGELEELVSGLVLIERQGESYIPVLAPQAVPPGLEPYVGVTSLSVEGDDYRTSVPLVGSWEGLPLHAVEITGRIESEQGFALVFKAPRKHVLDAANRAGFRLPESGVRYLDDDVLGMNIGVTDREDGFVELYCMPG